MRIYSYILLTLEKEIQNEIPFFSLLVALGRIINTLDFIL